MKENSIEREEEILNNIKAYMQESIDRGYHKFVYNDLGYDEKCVNVINAIEHVLSDYKRVLKENEELKNQEATARKINELLVQRYSNSISVQKIKDKIEEEIKYHEKNILDIENVTMLMSKTAKEEAEIEFNKYAIVVLNKILQELIEESE